MTDGTNLLDQFGSYFGISALASTVRMLISADRYTFFGRVRAYTVAFFVAWLCYLFLHPSLIDADWKVGIVGIAALMADDILRAAIALFQKFLGKPLELLAEFIRSK